MAAPYILANSLLDAHTFAREELGLGKGHYRVVTSPSSISGRRGTDLYLVPGYEKRYDRFAMAGALKYTRLNKIDVAEWREARGSLSFPLIVVPDDTEPPAHHAELVARVLPDRVQDDLEPAGEQLTLISTEEASAFFDLPEDVDSPLDQPGGSFDDFDAPAEEPKRRRRRCKDCGTLHFKDESCPSEPLPGV